MSVQIVESINEHYQMTNKELAEYFGVPYTREEIEAQNEMDIAEQEYINGVHLNIANEEELTELLHCEQITVEDYQYYTPFLNSSPLDEPEEEQTENRTEYQKEYSNKHLLIDSTPIQTIYTTVATLLTSICYFSTLFVN